MIKVLAGLHYLYSRNHKLQENMFDCWVTQMTSNCLVGMTMHTCVCVLGRQLPYHKQLRPGATGDVDTGWGSRTRLMAVVGSQQEGMPSSTLLGALSWRLGMLQEKSLHSWLWLHNMKARLA